LNPVQLSKSKEKVKQNDSLPTINTLHENGKSKNENESKAKAKQNFAVQP